MYSRARKEVRMSALEGHQQAAHEPPADAQAGPAQELQPAPGRGIVSAREIGRNRAAVAAGFVAGGGLSAALGVPMRALGVGPRTPVLKGRRMSTRKLD